MSAPLREDWNEEKIARLCTGDKWLVSITPTPDLVQSMSRVFNDKTIVGEITEADQKRLIPKLRIVEDIAAGLAAGMLKGTLKYKPESDTDSTIGEWWDELVSDATDTLNYVYLMKWRMKAIIMGQALAAQSTSGDPETIRGFAEELGVDFDSIKSAITGITEI
ncbi:hypothetical protein LCGC14_2021170, partial [marine sediment metagenome]